jgi:hypothetical protein
MAPIRWRRCQTELHDYNTNLSHDDPNVAGEGATGLQGRSGGEGATKLWGRLVGESATALRGRSESGKAYTYLT